MCDTCSCHYYCYFVSITEFFTVERKPMSTFLQCAWNNDVFILLLHEWIYNKSLFLHRRGLGVNTFLNKYFYKKNKRNAWFVHLVFLKTDLLAGRESGFCKINQWWIYNSLFIKQGKDTKHFSFFFFSLNIDNLSLTSQSRLCIFSCLETLYETTMQDRKKSVINLHNIFS